MSKSINSAAMACKEAILDINETITIVCTSRLYPNTRDWYVQAHAKLAPQDYVVAYMWMHEKKPTIMHFDTFAAFSEYLEYMYDIEV